MCSISERNTIVTIVIYLHLLFILYVSFIDSFVHITQICLLNILVGINSGKWFSIKTDMLNAQSFCGPIDERLSNAATAVRKREIYVSLFLTSVVAFEQRSSIGAKNE